MVRAKIASQQYKDPHALHRRTELFEKLVWRATPVRTSLGDVKQSRHTFCHRLSALRETRGTNEAFGRGFIKVFEEVSDNFLASLEVSEKRVEKCIVSCTHFIAGRAEVLTPRRFLRRFSHIESKERAAIDFRNFVELGSRGTPGSTFQFEELVRPARLLGIAQR